MIRSHCLGLVLASVVCSALCLPSPVLCDAHEGIGETPCSELLSFAEYLRAEGDYYRAVGEYKRFLFLCPDGQEAPAAELGIAECYFLAGRYRDAAEFASRYEADSEIGVEMALLEGHARFRLQEYDAAIPPLQSAGIRGHTSTQIWRAGYLNGIALVRLERFDEAVKCFSLVSDQSPYAERASSYGSVLAGLEQAYETRSPRVAAALGIVPGLGYAYCGHYRTGVASLIVNGLLAWAAADAFEGDNDGAGWTFAVLTAGFYFGNMTGSAQSAHRFNQYSRDEFQSRFPE